MTDPTDLPAPHDERLPPTTYLWNRDGTQNASVAPQDSLVAYTELQDAQGRSQAVSTAFLGIDASLGMDERPVLFETVIRGGRWSGAQYRYPTEAEAVHAHGELVAALAEHMVADGGVAEPGSLSPDLQAQDELHTDETVAGMADAAAVQ